MTNPKENEKPPLYIKCKNCGGIQADQLSIPSPGVRMYRCRKCGNTWLVQMGGNFSMSFGGGDNE